MTDLPQELRLEVKTSRSGLYVLSDRDLDGPGPSGLVIALINDRQLHGPRWVLAPCRVLRPRGYAELELSGLAELPGVAERLNLAWSNWILDREAWQHLFEQGLTQVAERIAWGRREHPPRSNQSAGNVRESRLSAALRDFRTAIDNAATGESGPQAEGQIHQALLKDSLQQLEYFVLQNPVGVPDIVATRDSGVSSTEIRDRLTAWEPLAARLVEARRALLALDLSELRQIIDALRR